MFKTLFRGCKQYTKSFAKSKRLIMQLPTMTHVNLVVIVNPIHIDYDECEQL